MAKINKIVTLLLYDYINNKFNDDNDKIIKDNKFNITALHVLIVYLINMSGWFAYYGPYNSAIRDNFYAE